MRTAVRLAALIAGLLPAACSTAPARVTSQGHQGPVTDLEVRRGVILSVSSAAVMENDSLVDLPEGIRVVEACYAPDGSLLLVGGVPAQRGVLIRVGGGAMRTLLERDDMLDAIACNVAGVIAVGGVDGRVHLVQPDGSHRLSPAAHQGPCRAVEIVNGTFVTAGRDGTVIVHGERPALIEDHTSGVECLCALPIPGVREAGIVSGARDGKVRLHDRNGRLIRSWRRLPSVVQCIAAEPDGNSLLAGCANGQIVRLAADRDDVRVVGDMAQPIHSLARDGSAWLVGVRDRWLRWTEPSANGPQLSLSASMRRPE